MKLIYKLAMLANARKALENGAMKPYEQYLYLEEAAKIALKKDEVLFVLIERNDATGVYIAEKHDLIAPHFNWTPADQVLKKPKIPLVGIRAYYVPKPIREVKQLLEEELGK